jgi:hypothetical protein
MRRKTPDDYRALAEKRGFCWLGPKVARTKEKTGWQCEKGHRWEANYNNISRGSGCPFCAGYAPKTPDDYYALALERGFRWLGPSVTNIKTETWWECKHGHQWKARYNNIQQGSNCPFCAGQVPKTAKDYRALAEERDFHWPGPDAPPNVTTKTAWECEQGHRWEATYAAIQQGNGCPFCAGVVPKTPDDYHALAEERRLRWVGPKVASIHDKTGWTCTQGHEWEARYNDIRRGVGCPFCAGVVPKTPDDYHALAEERRLRWVGPAVANTGTKTAWECEQGHRWEARYNDIQQGSGCPFCTDIVHGAHVSGVQRDLCSILDGELNKPFGRRNIDIALEVEGVAIAVEYDSWYWHAYRREQDVERDEELLAAGWHVLHIRSNSLLPTCDQLDAAIACLLAGQEQTEIVLSDWGEGPTRFEPD